MFLFFVYYHRPLQYFVCFDIIINIFIEKLISCNKKYGLRNGMNV